MDKILDQMAVKLTPSDEARTALHRTVDDLLLRARAVARELRDEGTPTFEPLLVGSAAKDTWLPEHVDLDVFLLFPSDLPRASLEETGLRAGKSILPAWRLRYAEHPYVHGTYDGYEADVVPAYRVADATKIQSAVDRTPFHNAWVMARLKAQPGLKRDIRLAKAWLRGIGAYGAETQQAGLSGYLTEVLVLHHDGFVPFLRAFADVRAGARFDPQGHSDATFPAALTVIDPVDPRRNAAAAVAEVQLDRVARAAKAFLRAPAIRFFEPAPLAMLDRDRAHRILDPHGLVVVALPIPEMREDALIPHLSRAAQSLGGLLEREGFHIVRTDGGLSTDGARAYLFVETTEAVLPAQREHLGPPAAIAARADDFRRKYEGNPDVVKGPFVTGSGDHARLAVVLRLHARSLVERVHGILDRAVSLGRHVDAALAKGPVAILDLEAVLSTPDLRPIVALHLSPREPWERTGVAAEDYPL